MSLTYEESKTVTEERELSVPDRWGMFSDQGNRRLKEIAEEAIEEVEEAISLKEEREAIVTYVYKWRKAATYDTYVEASDTAVRERVYSFAEKLMKASGLSDFGTADEIWSDSRERFKEYKKRSSRDKFSDYGK